MALTRNPSRGMQRQIDLTTAVCQERLLATHVRHVLALVDLVQEQLPFDEALDIYSRVLRLTPEQARNVGSRAFAIIGRRTGVPEDGPVPILPDDDSGEPEEPRAEPAPDGSGRFDVIFSRVRRRIRGRVHGDLRSRINLAAARAEDALFETHVDNSLTFARAMGEEMPLHEAVELYLEIMMIPEGVNDVVFNRALRLVADRELPPVREAQLPKREGDPRTMDDADAPAPEAVA